MNLEETLAPMPLALSWTKVSKLLTKAGFVAARYREVRCIHAGYEVSQVGLEVNRTRVAGDEVMVTYRSKDSDWQPLLWLSVEAS